MCSPSRSPLPPPQSENLKFTTEKRKGISETTIVTSPKHLKQHIKAQFPSEHTLLINSALNAGWLKASEV